jgi:hypothetical protein
VDFLAFQRVAVLHWMSAKGYASALEILRQRRRRTAQILCAGKAFANSEGIKYYGKQGLMNVNMPVALRILGLEGIFQQQEGST